MAARPGSATWCRFIGCNNPGASARKLVGGARGLWCGCALLSVTLLIYLMCGTREAGRWVRPRSFAYSADRSASLRSAGSSSRPEPEPYAGTEPTGTGEAEPFGQTGWLEGLDEELGLKLDSEGVPLSVPLSVPLPALQRNPKTALPKSLDARKEGSWSEPSKSKAKEMRRKRRVTGASQPGNGQYSGSLPKKTQLEATVQSKDKRETGDSQAGNDQHTEVMPDTKQSEAKAQKSDGLDTGASQPGPSKVAFMFISRGPMHTDRIWDRFFGGAASNDLYSVYIHW